MRGFRLARIFGIEIIIDWTLLLIFGLISWSLSGGFAKQMPGLPSWTYWLAAFLTAAIFIFSILFHEMAHSLVAKRFGIVVKRIILFIFGGAAMMEGKDAFSNPKSEFVISIVGPLSSAVLAGIFYVLAVLTDSPSYPSLKLLFFIFNWLCLINVVLAAFNMLPIFPMDGGRVFRSVLHWRMKNMLKATEIAAKLSVVLAILLFISAFFWLGLVNALWLGMIIFLIIIPSAMAEYRAVKQNNNSRN